VQTSKAPGGGTGGKKQGRTRKVENKNGDHQGASSKGAKPNQGQGRPRKGTRREKIKNGKRDITQKKRNQTGPRTPGAIYRKKKK